MINFYCTDVKMLDSHCWIIPMISVPYFYINYLGTIKNGKPLYWFMTWEDSNTLVVCLALMVGAMAIYRGLVALTVVLKPHNVSGRPSK